LITITKY